MLGVSGGHAEHACGWYEGKTPESPAIESGPIRVWAYVAGQGIA